jgi:hypothetical protein
MGVAYAASALHQLIFVVVDKNAPDATDPPSLRSPSIDKIVGWRDRLAIQYRSQLGELLIWDESSAYSEDIEIGVGADTLLRYVAARVAEAGPQILRDLMNGDRPKYDEIERAFDGAGRRGFTGRFPQLLLVSMYWLPFQRNMIIEEPDWRGQIMRFGSSFRLADELRELMTLIAAADPRATEWRIEQKMQEPDKTLWAAWQAGDAISRICAAANAYQLPLWTTG